MIVAYWHVFVLISLFLILQCSPICRFRDDNQYSDAGLRFWPCATSIKETRMGPATNFALVFFTDESTTDISTRKSFETQKNSAKMDQAMRAFSLHRQFRELDLEVCLVVPSGRY